MEAPRRGVSGLLSWDVGVLLNVYFFKFFFTRLHRVVEFFFALAFVHSTLMGFQRFSTIRQIFSHLSVAYVSVVHGAFNESNTGGGQYPRYSPVGWESGEMELTRLKFQSKKTVLKTCGYRCRFQHALEYYIVGSHWRDVHWKKYRKIIVRTVLMICCTNYVR